MANQDWSNLGDDIKNLVQSAIDSKDFKKLNETIGKTINTAMESVNQGLSQAGEKINEASEKINYAGARERDRYRSRYPKTRAQNPWEGRNKEQGYQVVKAPQARLFKSTAGTTGAGLALSITGYTAAAGLGIGALSVLLAGLVTGMHPGLMIALAVLIPLFIGGGIMAGIGTKMLRRAKRFKTYITYLQGRTYCSIKELADAIGKSEAFVLKDIRDMLHRRMFLEGHLDRQHTCLMVSHEAYHQYQEAELRLEERQKQKEQIAMEQEVEQEGLPEEVHKVIEEGNEYIRKIRACNDAIPGEEISSKISRMELIIRKIFGRVERHPELVGELHKFMGYYLPTTVKLLNAYEELDAQPVQGQNILTSKKEIEGTLDTINQAFENLLDGFFKDTAWDISTDISVLQTMLAQEGLTNSDFTTNDQEH